MIEKLAKYAGWIKSKHWWIGKGRIIKWPDTDIRDAIEAAQSVAISWSISNKYNGRRCAYASIHVPQHPVSSMTDRYTAVVYDPPDQWGHYEGENVKNLAKALTRATHRAIRGMEAKERRLKSAQNN